MVEWQTLISFGLLLVAVGGVMFGAIWKIFDGRITKLEVDHEKKVSQVQHDEFKEGMISRHTMTNKRLDAIEQSRPTTETLASVSTHVEATLSRLEGRLRDLENRRDRLDKR